MDEKDIIEYESDGELTNIPSPYKEADKDFDAVRDSMLTLIDQGNKGLSSVLAIAMATESPRLFDSFTSMLKVVGELNAKVLDIHKAKADISAPAGQGIKATTVNQTANNFFVGSTDELQKRIADMQLNKGE